MPFGAELGDDGTTRFRLWAPRAREVAVELTSGAARRTVPLASVGNGWFEARIGDTAAGTRYAYRVDAGDAVADPASRCNPDDVHAPSSVVDPCAYDWRDAAWRGRPWHEAVVYELHVGTFTPAGTFAAVIDRLDYLVALGVTAIELMPVADFPGQRNWGYDGVLLFAPDATYGTPGDLKRLVDAAHERGLMVLLDVVYNHFGPEGNYLHAIAPDFFNPAHHTPWGAAINFDGANNRGVRDFFIHNALYWLEEFHCDGLRFDAVHAIVDTSANDILEELTATVRRELAAHRHVHLVFENDRNAARYLTRDPHGIPEHATAQWNDDAHHAAHALVTHERDGYYADYAEHPLKDFGRALAEGFVHQGDWSAFRSAARGEPSAHLPSLAFINFLQNHDQIGNRAFGERITTLADPVRVRAAVACLLLAPSPPMLFMGEEFAASTPFLFFCDFGAELAAAVTHGRREEFSRFARFGDESARERIPDPNAVTTFEASRLRWAEMERAPHAGWLAFYRHCLAVRRSELVPRMARNGASSGQYAVTAGGLLKVRWRLDDGSDWRLDANFGSSDVHAEAVPRVVLSVNLDDASRAALPPCAVRVSSNASGAPLPSGGLA